MSRHIHVYDPDELGDEVIVQLHDDLHGLLHTYEPGIDGWQIPMVSPKPTEEMVIRAAQALQYAVNDASAHLSDFIPDARAALEAALGGGVR